MLSTVSCHVTFRNEATLALLAGADDSTVMKRKDRSYTARMHLSKEHREEICERGRTKQEL